MTTATTRTLKEHSIGDGMICSSCDKPATVSARMKKKQSRQCDDCYHKRHVSTLNSKTLAVSMSPELKDLINIARDEQDLNISKETRKFWKRRLKSLGYDVSET